MMSTLYKITNTTDSVLFTGEILATSGEWIEIRSGESVSARRISKVWGTRNNYWLATKGYGPFPIGEITWRLIAEPKANEAEQGAKVARKKLPTPIRSRVKDNAAQLVTVSETSSRQELPTCGAVFGGDIGYSLSRSTTGMGILVWDESTVRFACKNANSESETRIKVINQLRDQVSWKGSFAAAAFDGPLRPSLVVDTTQCRAAERLLMGGAFQHRGKPGPTNGGSGPALHSEATKMATLILGKYKFELPSFHPHLGACSAIESFPNLFFGVLLDETAYPVQPTKRRNWTCCLYPIVAAKLKELLGTLLPGRKFLGADELTDREHIAAFACVLTALCAAAGEFVAVGSPADGYIFLPPLSFWGVSFDNNGPRAARELELRLSIKKVRRDCSGAEIHMISGAGVNRVTTKIKESANRN
jgi:hypothetical protein